MHPSRDTRSQRIALPSFTPRRARRALLASALALAACGDQDAATEDLESESRSTSTAAENIGTIASADEALKNGTATTGKTAIGIYSVAAGWCSGVLITPRHVLTAMHCVPPSHVVGAGDTFTAGGVTRAVTRLYVVGAEENPGDGIPPGSSDLNPDVAILELASAVPGSSATPLNLAAGRPTVGDQVTIYGMSGTGAACANPGTRRFVTFNFGAHTTEFCPGDSGGPAIHGNNAGFGAIWGVASFTPAGLGDVWGDVSRFKEDILGAIRIWNTGSTSGFTALEPGISRNGVLLSTRSNTSATACRDACNANSSCNSYQHTTSTNSCRLLRDAGDWVPNVNSSSGLSSANRFEVGVDRPGFDYRNFVTTLADCSSACSNEKRCAAFSYQSAEQRCWLKAYLGTSRAATGVTSGTKRGFEYFTDRPGSDIERIDMVTADVRACQSMCATNASCQAYTYVKQTFKTVEPWGVDQDAVCFLKSAAPAPRTGVTHANRLLVSGLKRSTP